MPMLLLAVIMKYEPSRLEKLPRKAKRLSRHLRRAVILLIERHEPSAEMKMI